MAVDLAEHTLAEILSTDELTEIEAKFYYHEQTQLKKIGFVKLDIFDKSGENTDTA